MRREERIVRRNLSLHGAGGGAPKGVEFEDWLSIKTIQ
jgi:hypothetical protein